MSLKTLYEFNQLSLAQRADYLWEHGNFILSVKEPSETFNLYTLFDYYVEVETSQERILGVRAFKKGHLMEKYLLQINIH